MSTTTSADGSATSIITPQDHDVMLGVAEKDRNHLGTQFYLQKIQEYSNSRSKLNGSCVDNSSSVDDSLVKESKLIIDFVASKEPPGQFLERDASSGKWTLISDQQDICSKIISDLKKSSTNILPVSPASLPTEINTEKHSTMAPDLKSQGNMMSEDLELCSSHVEHKTPDMYPSNKKKSNAITSTPIIHIGFSFAKLSTNNEILQGKVVRINNGVYHCVYDNGQLEDISVDQLFEFVRLQKERESATNTSNNHPSESASQVSSLSVTSLSNHMQPSPSTKNQQLQILRHEWESMDNSSNQLPELTSPSVILNSNNHLQSSPPINEETVARSGSRSNKELVSPYLVDLPGFRLITESSKGTDCATGRYSSHQSFLSPGLVTVSPRSDLDQISINNDEVERSDNRSEVPLIPQDSSTQSLTSSPVIFSPGANDVAHGPGASQKTPGNRLYRDLILQHAEEYEQTSDDSIIDKVFFSIISANGRFLCLDKATGFWQQLSEKKKKRKIKDAFNNLLLRDHPTPHVVNAKSKNNASSTPDSVITITNEKVQNGQSLKENKNENKSELTHLPGEHDIMCGRGVCGRRLSFNPGNLHYCQLIGQYQQAYRNGDTSVIDAIMSTFECLDPPGRFLSQPNFYAKWEELSDDKIREKINKALSDRRGYNIKRQDYDIVFDKNLELHSDENPGNAWMLEKIEEYSDETHQNRKENSIVEEIMKSMKTERYPPIRFLKASRDSSLEVMSEKETEEQIISLLQKSTSKANWSSSPPHCTKIESDEYDSDSSNDDNETHLSRSDDDESDNSSTTRSENLPGTRETDVICGNNTKRSHPGNMRYNLLIEKYCHEFSEVRDTSIIYGIIDTFHRLDPPGRFMRQSHDKEWNELSKEDIVKKTSKALMQKCKQSTIKEYDNNGNDVKFGKTLKLLTGDVESHVGYSWLVAKIEEYNDEKYNGRKEKSIVNEIMSAMDIENPPVRFMKATSRGKWGVMPTSKVRKAIELQLRASYRKKKSNDKSSNDSISSEDSDASYTNSTQADNSHDLDGDSDSGSEMPARKIKLSKLSSTSSSSRTTKRRRNEHDSSSRVSRRTKCERYTSRRTNADDRGVQSNHYTNATSNTPEIISHSSESMERNCALTLRSLSKKGRLGPEISTIIHNDMVCCKLNGSKSKFLIAYEMLCGEGDEAEIAEEEYAALCEKFIASDE